MDQEVCELLANFLTRYDAALPGTVEGLYLVGSLALGDYRPGRSDIDFVAVSPEALDDRDREKLAAIHSAMKAKSPRPYLDGVYVTWADLLRDPTTLTDVPYSLEGEFHPSGAFEANPAVWLTLRDHSIAVRGRANPSVRHEPEELRRWTRENLRTYWQGLVDQGRAARDRGVIPGDEIIAWCVPGVLRLRYTLATGGITSKSGACVHGLQTLPEHRHPIIADALALHHGEHADRLAPAQRLEETLSLMQAVIDESGEGASESS